MAIQLDIKSELPTAIKWTNEHTKQLPFSIAQAMTASAKGITSIPGSKQKSALNGLAQSSKRFLDRPRPQTSTGFFATTANKRTLQVLIEPKSRFKGRDGTERGWNRNRYLSGNIFGGQRAVKAYEVEFAKKSNGTIQPGTRFVPTRFMKLDKFGNPKRTEINRLINNVGTGMRTGNNIFIGQPVGGGRPFGVYKRERQYQLRALFIVDQSQNYTARFPAQRVIEQRVTKTFGAYLRLRLAANVAANVREGRADMRTGLF